MVDMAMHAHVLFPPSGSAGVPRAVEGDSAGVHPAGAPLHPQPDRR